MERVILKNGVRVIYNYRPGMLTSFCIGFEAGAFAEDVKSTGLAHIVEHMLFKGTADRNEYEINKLCEEYFGFHNAMTNYPYSIYYGTTLSENFSEGFNIYSDILMKPSFHQAGFKEEINIILSELRDWKDDSVQYCEDTLFFNAFQQKRMKNLIIGDESTLQSFGMKDVRNFYDKYYCPENCVITVVSALDFEIVFEVINNNFKNWEKAFKNPSKIICENNKAGLNFKIRDGLEGAKIQYCFTLQGLDSKGVLALKLFNLYFGEGTDSLLYNEIRTEKALAYDVFGEVKDEKGMELFNIKVGTSDENIEKVINIINSMMERIKKIKGIFTEEHIKRLTKIYKTKIELKHERSVELCKSITTNEIMFNSLERIIDIDKIAEGISEEYIIDMVKKVFHSPTIQVIASKE